MSLTIVIYDGFNIEDSEVSNENGGTHDFFTSEEEEDDLYGEDDLTPSFDSDLDDNNY